MADAIAVREFRYRDFQTKQVVTVRRGERLDPAVLGRSNVDVAKMLRTGYAESSEVAVSPPPKRRGRPPKNRE